MRVEGLHVYSWLVRISGNLNWSRIRRAVLLALAGGCLMLLLYWGLKLLALYYIYRVLAAWATQGIFPSFWQFILMGLLALFVFGRFRLGTIHVNLGTFKIDVVRLIAPLSAYLSARLVREDEDHPPDGTE